MKEKIVRRLDALPALPIASAEERTKQRVAVYARVSTDKDEQQTSLEAQKDYYQKLIAEHPDWQLAGVYADEGVTGTSLRREAFRQMMEDCEFGRVDRILTKSVSRFARNTVDALKSIRLLKDRGIGVYFEKENIWTLDSKGEFLITLMTSLAQEESRSISENVTWAHRKNFAEGKYYAAYSHFLGYDKGFVINEAEACIVRRIFKLFVQGMSCDAIARQLTAEGIASPAGNKRWHDGTIRGILANEKYKGDALLQKTFTVSFLGHKVKKNNGELPQYYVKGSHEAIIAPWLFDYVQDEMKRRCKPEYRYEWVGIFSGRLICGNCGRTYFPNTEHSNDKYKKVVWICRNRFDRKVHCRNMRIPEKSIDYLLCTIASTLLKKRKTAMDLCQQVMQSMEQAHLISILQEYSTFTFASEGDLVIIIQQIVAHPDGKLQVKLIDGRIYKVTVTERLTGRKRNG